MELVSNTQNIVDFISQPWHWAVSGAAIASLVFFLTWMGRRFGVSTAFQDLCKIAGAEKFADYFRYDLKNSYWRLAFIAGAIGGGFLASTLLVNPETIELSTATVAHLQNDWGISAEQGGGFLPVDLFNFSNPKGILLTIIGGFLVGFGARYGSGCTSGHAITGLSHLQLPSFLTVIGFFIGGLIMTWLIMPLIF